MYESDFISFNSGETYLNNASPYSIQYTASHNINKLKHNPNNKSGNTETMSSVEVISHNHTLLNSRKTFIASQTYHSSEILKDKTVSEVVSLIRDMAAFPVKQFDNLRSRSSDSGKSSSCSPMPLDCIEDSGEAVDIKHNDNDTILRKRIQEGAFILLSLERNREKFRTLRNRLR